MLKHEMNGRSASRRFHRSLNSILFLCLISIVNANNPFLLNYKYNNNMSGHQMVTGDRKKESVCGHQKITKNQPSALSE